MVIGAITYTMHAQDVIVKKDGTPILTKVLEVNADNVRYKKHGNPKGPTYTIAISDILSLTYANGDKEDFGNTATVQTEITPSSVSNTIADAPQGLVQLPADSRNAEIIRQYSTIYQPTNKIKRSNAKASRCFIFCGVKENSLMSNEELEMTFEAKDFYHYEVYRTVRRYLLKLTNKTDKTIYVDKGNCFRISSDGKAYNYYDTSVHTAATIGGGSGATMNVGAVAGVLGIGGVVGQLADGLNVGGGTQHSVSTTYNQQRILSIPPHSFCYLTEDKFVQTQKNGLLNAAKYHAVESSESFLFMNLPVEQIGISKDVLHEGEVRTFFAGELPWSRKYTITYSTSETFNTYSCLQCDMYIKEVVGSRKPKNLDTKYERFVYGEDRMISNNYSKFISSLDSYGIVGFTMFDGKDESGTGTVIGPN